MSDFVLGVLVYAVSVGAIGLFMVAALRRGRQAGEAGAALVTRLAPYFLADLALTAVFVVWLLGQV